MDLSLLNLRKERKAQSAIEYLMTYGWMLLVVAVAGGAVFSIVQSESIESASGFTGADVVVENFGLSSEGKLDLILRNSASESLDINEINLSQDGEEFSTGIDQEISVGDSSAVSALGAVESSSGASSVDVEISYDVGGLEGQVVTGSVSGSLDVVMSGETETSNWAYVDVSEASSEVVDTSGMNDFYMMQYEASTASNMSRSERSGNIGDYEAVSMEKHAPWNAVDRGQAAQACQDQGYSLPSNKQWQAATMAEIGDSSTWPAGNNNETEAVEDGSTGVPSEDDLVLTGSGPESWSNELEIYDLNGNVAEYTSTTVDRSHPMAYDTSEANITTWNRNAYPESIGSSNQDLDNATYRNFFNYEDNMRVVRGGSMTSKQGAGAFYLGLIPELTSITVSNLGFRCIVD